MAQLIPNRWHLRQVADSAARSCFICYKPSSSVLITPDNKDFFYVCSIHLKDSNFCTPILDESEVAARKQRETIEREIEKVKKEYEERMKRKKEKEKQKKEKGDKDGKDGREEQKKSEKDEEEKKAEQEKDDKIKEIQTSSAAGDDTPRIFSLHKNFYQMRIDRLRSLEQAKRNRERMKNASFFPSAPNGDL